ncbi:hypothetical protein [Burkholderia glumae]|uniref:hypothetical protein n=1 Tax=Burkholderia glumae TaxID=337 RepID=UPI002151CDC7|nr:hypothetical protein [Burkholderia glumae]
MSSFVGMTFGPGVVVMLDGNEFDRCTFDHCQLIFCGGPFAVMNCSFGEPQIVFDGAAARTLAFVREMGGMAGSAAWFEEVIARLRERVTAPSLPSPPFPTTMH